MGTSLTGLTPATTYDALIKVGDNGPLSATAKVLSDGLGNDSVLALSTTAVGIGNSSPAATLDVASRFLASSNDGNAEVVLASTSNRSPLLYFKEGSTQRGLIYSAAGSNNLIFQSGTSEAMRIDASGNVGIGTSSPVEKLDVIGSINISTASFFRYNDTVGIIGSGSCISGGATTQLGIRSSGDILFSAQGATERFRITANGVTFNGDTAAANALDDYEEGTWTPNFTLNSGSVSAYTSSGSYTKIGKVVNLTMRITFTTTLLAEIDEITGYPFTSQTSSPLALGAVREATNSGKMWQWLAFSNSTQGILRRYDNDKVLTNGDSFVGTLTYFV